MRICSYNIHGGRNASGRDSLEQIVTTLRETNADVVLLQEVDRYLARSGFRDQVAFISEKIGFSSCFYGRLRFARSAFGNAILTRTPAKRVVRLPLSSSGGEPRCALAVHLTDDTVIWNTHLGLRDDWRTTQLTSLAGAVAESSARIIVGGDFNARLDSAEIQMFLQLTGMAPISGDTLTFPAAAPEHRIDFLFGRGVSSVATGVDAAAGSDHCLIWADVGAKTVPAG